MRPVSSMHRWINSGLCALGLGLAVATLTMRVCVDQAEAAARERDLASELQRLEMLGRVPVPGGEAYGLALSGPLTTNLVCSADDSCVASISGPLPLPLPIPVASGDGVTGAVAGPWTLVNSCALTADLTCSADDVVFTRASAATCDHADGTRTNLATGVACHDATWGLRVEGTSRTNMIVYSDAISGGSWTPGAVGVAVPTVTGDQANGRDGQLLCDKIDFPSVQDTGQYAHVYQGFSATAAPWSCAIDVKGVSGSGTVCFRCNAAATYVECNYNAASWTRCEIENSTLTAATHYLAVAVHVQAGNGCSAQPAQSIYACAAQAELGAWSSSYITTEASTVTRAAETATLATTGWDPASVRITGTLRPVKDLDQTCATAACYWFSVFDGTNGLGIYQDAGNLTGFSQSASGQALWTTAATAWNADTSYAIDAQMADDAVTVLRDDLEVLADTTTAYWPAALPSPAKIGNGTAQPLDAWYRALNIYEPTP